MSFGVFVVSCFAVRDYIGLHEIGNVLGRVFLPEVVVAVWFRMIFGEKGCGRRGVN